MSRTDLIVLEVVIDKNTRLKKEVQPARTDPKNVRSAASLERRSLQARQLRVGRAPGTRLPPKATILLSHPHQRGESSAARRES